MATLGNPENVVNTGEQEFWSYYVGEGYGQRTYTYIFRGDLLVDARYNDNGPYNGMTARQSQGK